MLPCNHRRDAAMMSFSEKLKAARSELGYTQTDLANQAGMCLQSVVNYEKNRVVPRPSTLHRLAEVLHVSTRYLSDDHCDDPLTDIEQDLFFQDAQKQYRRLMRQSSPVLASDCQAMFSRTDLTQQQKDALFEAVKDAYLSCRELS
jgi:transcriptional regulator with XRE-family HTH domain